MAMLPVPIGMGVPVFVFFTTVARHGRNSTLQCADYAPKCVEGEFCDFAFTEFSEDEMRRPTPCAVPLGSAKANGL
jgi:hypothetical protein